MKIIDLRKKTLNNFTASFVILLLLGVGYFLNSRSEELLDKRIKKSQNEISSIKSNIVNLENKRQEIKKYVEIWKKIQANKINENGINMDEVNSSLSIISKKYNISKVDIKVNLPRDIKSDIFNTKNVNVLFTEATLTFNSLDDVGAIKFLKEFLDSINGYKVIGRISIEKKIKNLEDGHFINISLGNNPEIILVTTNFFWYSFKENENSSTKNNRLIK